MSILPSDCIAEAVPQISAERYRLFDDLRSLWQKHQIGERADTRFQIQFHCRAPEYLSADASMLIRLPHNVPAGFALQPASGRRVFGGGCLSDASQSLLRPLTS